jgi:hypothetical protein
VPAAPSHEIGGEDPSTLQSNRIQGNNIARIRVLLAVDFNESWVAGPTER